MGDCIEFPNQYNTHIKNGLAAVQTERWHEAEKSFRAAYQLRQTAESNYLYFTVLTELGRFDEAVRLCEELMTYYLEDDLLYAMYIEAVISSGQFLKAESLILDKIKNAKRQETRAKWKRQLDHLDQSRQEVVLEKEKQDKILEKKLYSLSEYTPLEQLEILKDVKGLSQKTLKKAYYSLLTNPFVSQTAKTYCLLALLEQGETATADLIWFGEDKKIDLNQLEVFEKHPIVQELQGLLEENLYKDPLEMKMIQQELNFHLMQIYPFIEEVIQDSHFWLHLYIDRYIHYSKESDYENEEEIRMYEWFESLTQNI
ncbi:MAG: hypothetical protein Q4F26_00165 [Atopococcus tabaci]|uniref:Tetratricopeptide repeat protein n=1 Tax=Atopococcus tabaci TaxID=269774 RepID=A0AA43RKC5_9LACT|nr:hypothetical protein [Atopococcus tabaci]